MSMTVSGPPWVVDIPPAVSGAGNPAVIANSSTQADFVANTAAIQAALAGGRDVTISGRPGDVVIVSETLILPAKSKLSIAAGVSLQQGGTARNTVLRTGNCERYGTRINGLIVIGHTGVSDISFGVVRLVKSGSNYSFSYMGPGQSAYGTAVVLTASGKATLISGAHALLIRSALDNVPQSDGTYTQTVQIVPSAMPARPVAITRTTTTATATETAHGRLAGDLVMVFGANTFDGLFRILSVPDSDTYTYADTTGAGSGAGYAYASSDTTIEMGPGASIKSKLASASSVSDSMMMQFLLVNGLVVSGGTYKNATGGKYCANIQGVTRMRASRLYFDNTCSDGFTIQGAAFDVQLESSGTCGDNIHGIGCTPSDYFAIHRPAENGTNAIDGVRAKTSAKSQVLEAVRIFGGLPNAGGLSARIDNIDIDVDGTFSGSSGVSILGDNGTTGLLDRAGMYVGRVSVKMTGSSLPDTLFMPVSMNQNSVPGQVDDLTVTGSYTWNNTQTFGYPPGFFTLLGGNVTNLLAQQCTVKDAGGLAGGGTRFAGVVNVKSGGLVTKGRVTNCTINGSQRIYAYDAGISQQGAVAIDNCDCPGAGVAFVLAGNSWATNISFSNITGVISTALYSNTAASPSTKCSITGSGFLAKNTLVNLSGTAMNVSVNGNLSVDATKITPTAGDTFINSNAAYTGGTGSGAGTYTTSAAGATVKIA